MDLIERYVRAVKKYLPNNLKEDIGKELKANIMDMLPENYTEKDVYKVLEELGNPGKLAQEYNPNKRYLIGPAYYDKYLSVLKLVIGIAMVVSFAAGLFAYIVEFNGSWNLSELIVNLIESTIGGAMQAAFWVTFIFISMERSGVDLNELTNKKKEWTPDDLPPLVEEKLKISRAESVISIIMTILFTTLFYFNPGIIAMYLHDGTQLEIIPLLNEGRLSVYLVFIIIFAIVQLIIFIWKYIKESWDIPLAIVNASYNILSSLLVFVMLSDSALINSEFISKLTELLNVTNEEFIGGFNSIKWFILAIIVVVNLWESIYVFIKLSDSNKY